MEQLLLDTIKPKSYSPAKILVGDVLRFGLPIHYSLCSCYPIFKVVLICLCCLKHTVADKVKVSRSGEPLGYQKPFQFGLRGSIEWLN